MKGRKLLLLPAMLLATSGLSSCSMLCTVTWLDWDDTVLELDEHIFPFEFLRYDGKTPTREQDAQYTYEFAGWEPVKASVSMPKRVIKRDTVYRATYTSTIRSYTITFKDASGVTLNSQVLNYGEYPQFRPEDYSTASYDYEFLGWDKPLSMVTGDEVYTANFKSTLRSYDVTWLNYDGTELATTSVAYGSYPYFGPEDPVREVPEGDEDYYRYDFVGWQKDGYDYIGLSPVFGEATYVAQYELYEYAYFEMNYLVYYNDVWYHYGENDVELYVREHEDLELPSMISGLDVEWYLDEGFQKPVTVIKDIYDDMAFYAKVLGEHEFAITYNLNGGELEAGATNPESITWYDYPVILEEPSKEGYDFAGWYDQDGNNVWILYDVYSDLDLTAEYIAHKWTISFVCTDCDEDIDPLEEVAYDSEFELPDAVKTGYEFLGWKEANAQDYFTSPMKADYDVTLYPEFEIINYPITYQLGVGETCDTSERLTYNVLNINEALPVPEKNGYTFKGWEFVSPSHPGIVVQALGEVDGLLGPVTIKPKWEALPIRVSFDLDGGTKEFNVNFMDGDTLLKTEKVAYEVNEVGYYVPEDKVGFQFAGWENFPEDPINGDVTLQAKWNELYSTFTGEQLTSIKIGEQKQLSLHNMNGKYLQFTPLVDQKVKVSSSGQVDLLMNASAYPADHVIAEDGLNYEMEFDVEAGESYVLRVFGATNTDGVTTIKLERADGDELIPDSTITAALDDSVMDLEMAFDATLSNLVKPVKAGYQFDGWFCGNKRYKDGDQIKETQDFTLVAHWSVPAE